MANTLNTLHYWREGTVYSQSDATEIARIYGRKLAHQSETYLTTYDGYTWWLIPANGGYTLITEL